MGVRGTLEYISEAISNRHSHIKTKKSKHIQTVNLKIKMDCDGCEFKIKNALSSLTGVKSVEINRNQHKVTVTGYVDPKKVLKKARSTGKKSAEMWPYIPYNLVARPYAPGAYDKKAPPGFVRKVPDEGSFDVADMFSDENPNACSMM